MQKPTTQYVITAKMANGLVAFLHAENIFYVRRGSALKFSREEAEKLLVTFREAAPGTRFDMDPELPDF